MPVFFSPAGNPEVWAEKPAGYLTKEERDALYPPVIDNSPPSVESQISSLLSQLAQLDAVYLTSRVLAGLATGDSYAQTRWEEHEAECAPLRSQLAELREEAE
jgi:hypothetical protein